MIRRQSFGISLSVAMNLIIGSSAIASKSEFPAVFSGAVEKIREELRAKNFSGIISVEIAGQSRFQYATSGINTNSVFWVGSVSKQFAAVAALKLIDQGKISLESPINERLGLPKNALARSGKNCTLANLLNHFHFIAHQIGENSPLQVNTEDYNR